MCMTTNSGGGAVDITMTFRVSPDQANTVASHLVNVVGYNSGPTWCLCGHTNAAHEPGGDGACEFTYCSCFIYTPLAENPNPTVRPVDDTGHRDLPATETWLQTPDVVDPAFDNHQPAPQATVCHLCGHPWPHHTGPGPEGLTCPGTNNHGFGIVAACECRLVPPWAVEPVPTQETTP